MANNLQEQFIFKFELKTNPEYMTIDGFVPGILNRFTVTDSIINYFPYMELVINDDASLFTEDYFFTEFLDLLIKFDSINDIDKIRHNFYWSEHQMNYPNSREIITGVTIIPGLSNFKKQDEVKSNSYYNNISTIVRQIMSKYSYPDNNQKLNISETSNFDYHYQGNEYDYQFIIKLADQAYSPKNVTSPFYTFINLRGEFFFQSVQDMIDQKPKQTLFFGDDNGESNEVEKKYLNNIINTYTYQYLGVPNNIKDYHKSIYKVNSSGEYVNKSYKIKDQKQKLGFNKLSIRNQDLTKVRETVNFGIVDSPIQESMYKGWVNRLFINSVSFPYRLKVQLRNLNLALCSGDCIETSFVSANPSRNNKFGELSGKWIILESGHGFDANGQAATSLTLGKPTLDIFKKHKFYSDFI